MQIYMVLHANFLTTCAKVLSGLTCRHAGGGPDAATAVDVARLAHPLRAARPLWRRRLLLNKTHDSQSLSRQAIGLQTSTACR